jgi:hypothetical protein
MKHLATALASVIAATSIVSVAQPARADNLTLTCKSSFPQMEVGHSSAFVSQLTYLTFYFKKWLPSNIPLQNGQCSLAGRSWQSGDPNCVLADIGQFSFSMSNGTINTASFYEHPDLAGFVLGRGYVYHFKAHVDHPCWKVDW